MHARLAAVCAALALVVPGAAPAQRTAAPEDAKVYFISPVDGDEVTETFVVRFGLSGMGVAPAGITYANTGHHHLLIDTPVPDLNQSIPADDKHVHFGAGQTEATVTLPPGEHTLQLLLGDQVHRPHAPPVISDRIHIRVK